MQDTCHPHDAISPHPIARKVSADCSNLVDREVGIRTIVVVPQRVNEAVHETEQAEEIRKFIQLQLHHPGWCYWRDCTLIQEVTESLENIRVVDVWETQVAVAVSHDIRLHHTVRIILLPL